MELENKKCVPCEGFLSPMTPEEESRYLKEVSGWKLQTQGVHKIQKEYQFDDFKGSMQFVNKVATIAEDEGHHPDIYIYYNKVVIELYTHAVKGLFKNDFIIAAKIDMILQSKDDA